MPEEEEEEEDEVAWLEVYGATNGIGGPFDFDDLEAAVADCFLIVAGVG